MQTERKTARINVVVTSEIKKKLLDKAEDLGLTLTSFIEKLSREQIIFLDKNLKTFSEMFSLKKK